MMAEALVENQVCDNCGAAARPGATFCYNCGASVMPDKEDGGNHTNYDTKVLDKIGTKSRRQTEQENQAAAGGRSGVVEERNKKGESEPELKSAASMRNKPKSIERKKVEVIWEEPESAPNLWFLVVAAILVVFSVIVWMIALQLK